MQQSKNDLEVWYKDEDPWQYRTTQDDIDRRERLLYIMRRYGPFDRALDIGAGEGFVTEMIPSTKIHAIEISDLAATRFAPHIKRVHEPEGMYDFVMTTGTMYQQYDHEKIYQTIKKCSAKYILIAGIKDWLIDYKYGTLVHEEEFQYREYIQKVSLYEISA